MPKKKLSFKERNAYNCVVADVGINGERIQRGFKFWPITECTAELTLDGADGSRVTASRVIAGTILAGPVGAVVGGLAKKGNETGYLIVQTPSGEQTVKLSGGRVAKAKKFMMNFEIVQQRALAE